MKFFMILSPKARLCLVTPSRNRRRYCILPFCEGVGAFGVKTRRFNYSRLRQNWQNVGHTQQLTMLFCGIKGMRALHFDSSQVILSSLDLCFVRFGDRK